MTIEDWIDKASIEERNYPAMSEDYHNLTKWLEELQKLRKENAEMKRLLKLAIEHLSDDIPICENCKKLDTDECDPESDCSCFEWLYSDEAKGLIENGNELDSGV